MQGVTTTQLAYKGLTTLSYAINAKYHISWEHPDLLVKLSGSASAPAAASVPSGSLPPTSTSAPFIHRAPAAAFDVTAPGKTQSWEHAITLAGMHARPYTTATAAVISSSSGLPVELARPPRPATCRPSEPFMTHVDWAAGAQSVTAGTAP